MSLENGEGWRERLPFNIDLSEDEDEDVVESKTQENNETLKKESEEQDERTESLESFSQDEEELAGYLNFGKTPPRLIRRRRQKERDAYCLQAKEAAKTIKATLKSHTTVERFMSLPGYNELNPTETPPEKCRQRMRSLKRSKDRQRTFEREIKQTETKDIATGLSNQTFEREIKNTEASDMLTALQSNHLPASTISVTPNKDSDRRENSRCESMPLTPAMLVKSKTRFMSVTCLALKRSNKKDGDNISNRRISTPEYPLDRVAFHNKIQKAVNTSLPDLAHWPPERSKEEDLYMEEVYEMIWLELQAWHAGQDLDTADVQLVIHRTKVTEIYEEVLNFSFNPTPDQTENTILDDLIILKDLKIGGIQVVDMDSTDGVGPSRMSVIDDDGCPGCLSIWCSICQDKQTMALVQVEELLKKIEYVESLFSSTKKIIALYPEWNDPEFVGRYKALCVWYNATIQLRMKIETLGRLLGHMTNALIPWPTFASSPAPHPATTRDSGYPHDDYQTPTHTLHTTPSNLCSQTVNSKPPPIVSFSVDDDPDEGSSNPSDSNNSTDSGQTTASSSRSTTTTSSSRLTVPHHPMGIKRCSSTIFFEANPYREYVAKLLRNKGLKTTFEKVAEVVRDVIRSSICILEESGKKVVELGCTKGFSRYSTEVASAAMQGNLEELCRFGPWTPKFEAMQLPPFHAIFHFLSSVSLHMIRECLKHRLEGRPEQPSRLSIKELMREYKEGVKFAVLVRQKYLRCCQALYFNLSEDLRQNLETRQNQAIEELDGNMKKMLEVYLDWLDSYVLMLHREPHVSRMQKNFLQEEWRFVQATCPHVTEGDSLAATRFCSIACHMLCSVRDFIDTSMDDLMVAMEDTSLGDIEELQYAEEQLDPDDIQRRSLQRRCRDLQVLLGETRERSLRAVGLAKMLRKDLEIAAEFILNSDPEVVLKRMLETGHIRVIAPHSQNHFIFIPGRIKERRGYIWQLLDMRVGGYSAGDSEVNEEGGYLILLKLDNHDKFSRLWKGDVIKIEPTADCTITLSRIQVQSLMLVVGSGHHLVPMRREFLRAMGSTIMLIHDQTTPNKAITHSVDEMKNAALELCKNLATSVEQVETMTNLDTVPDVTDTNDRYQLHLITRDVIHQYFMFGFEYHKEVTRLVTGHQRSVVAPHLVNFLRKWMSFVQQRYSMGKKKKRPRWSNSGLDFIIFVCDPYNTRHLDERDFLSLNSEIEECIAYIEGTRSPQESNVSSPATPGPITPQGHPKHLRYCVTPLPPIDRSLSQQSNQSDHPSPTVNVTDSPLLSRKRTPRASIGSSVSSLERPKVDNSDSLTPIECVRHTLVALDQQIDEELREKKLIGRVSNTQRDKIDIKPRSVSFSWQRGFKIGAGRFGKVYTAVNNNTGELMAMKVLPLQANDHRSIRRLADELRILESISQPNLVICYGVEILNDEMLMFMEYCDEGTLESLALSTETGLSEELVRKYVRQLLEAVHALHEKSIVHRDIKGANIFLTNEGNTLKLGDFGCAVRLRGHQTEIGELAGIVGTHAYMAPEIFQSSEGHGRAADIWSVGCVVIEMATGKRPWPEYDSSVQIMFRVGMGQRPTTPARLSEEGHEFLEMSFVHDRHARATAAQLLDHAFIKVDTGEDYCTSLPLFSNNPMVPYMKLVSNM